MNGDNVILSNHVQWLQDPVTKSALSILNYRIDKAIDEIAAQSLNKDLPDSFIRHYGAQVRILKTIKKEMYESSAFIEILRIIQSQQRNS